MMSSERSLTVLLNERRSKSPPLRDRSALSRRRSRMVRAIHFHLMRIQHRRQRFGVWRRIGVGILAVGPAITSIAAYKRSTSIPSERLAMEIGKHLEASEVAGVGVEVLDGVLLQRRGGSARDVAPGANIQVDWADVLETPSKDGADLRLSNVVAMAMSPETKVDEIIGRHGHVERITLSMGRLHLNVAKLKEGRRFHVKTPSAELKVRGTAFDVEVLGGVSPSTCVRVQEGLIEVTTPVSSDMLGAGQAWGCERRRQPGAIRRPVPELVPTVSRRALPIGRALGLQNRLFQKALRAHQIGDLAEAIKFYTAFLDRYPNAPLSAQARANLAAVKGAERP